MNETALRRETEVLLARFETEPTHPLHVSRLALALFDQLAGWHGWGNDERLLLEAAATLHDLGWSQTRPDGAGHHKASAKLIREHPWAGLTAREVGLIALIARYHRKALPAEEHEAYAALSAADRRRVRLLAGLLRVADGLDRRHVQAVTGVAVETTSRKITVTALGESSLDAELAAADKKADLLRLEFGGPVELAARPAITAKPNAFREFPD